MEHIETSKTAQYGRIRLSSLTRLLPMSKCRNFEWEDYIVTVRPTSWRNIIRFWPYLSGSDVRFKINLKTKDGKERTFTYLRIVQRFYLNAAQEVVPRYEHTETARIFKDDFHEYFVTTGEYSIQVMLEENKKSSKFEVLTNFSVLERDKIVPYVAFSIISIILGAGLTLLIQWIINLLTS